MRSPSSFILQLRHLFRFVPLGVSAVVLGAGPGCVNAEIAWDMEGGVFGAVQLAPELEIEGFSQISSGDCNSYRIKVRTAATAPLTFGLGLSGIGTLYTASDCALPLSDSEIILAGGSSSATFYYKGTGAGPLTLTASNTTLRTATLQIQITIPAPDSLMVTPLSATSLTLSWMDRSQDEIGFTLSRSTDGVTFAALTSLGPSVTTYSDTGLTTGQIYYYQVRATNAGGSSADSAVASGIPDVAPAAPTLSSPASNVLSNLNDQAVSGSCGGAASMRILVGGTIDSTVVCTANAFAGNVNRTTDLPYILSVQGVSAGGLLSALSSTVTWTRDTAPPTAPTITAPAASLSTAINTQSISGTCDSGDAPTVRIYVNGSLDSSVACTGSAFSGTVSRVIDNPYSITANSVDAAGNLSADSNLRIWTRDTLAPPNPNIVVPASAVTTNSNVQAVSGACSGDAVEVQIYVNGSPEGARIPCTGSAFSTSVTRMTDSAYSLTARSYDLANNSSGLSTPQTWTRMTVTPSAPTALVANSLTSSSVNLTWADNSSTETGFEIERSVDGGTTYSLLTTAAAGVISYVDGGRTTRETYYYRVRAVNVAGPSSYSNVSSAMVRMNIVVPIEMLDVGLASTNTSPVTFNRSATTYLGSAYDGVVSLSLELVATNIDASSKVVEVYDQTSSLVASITVPALTNTPKRFEVSWVPTPWADYVYRLRVPNTMSPGQLAVNTARLLVKQVSASMTRIYIPLTASGFSSSNNSDIASGSTTVDQTTSLSYNQPQPSRYGVWRKNSAAWVGLAAGTPWSFEALLSGGTPTAIAALFNRSTGMAVTSVNVSGSLPTLQSSSFSDAAGDFSNNEDYEVRIASSLASPISLYKAGLWVRLDALRNAEVYYRVMKQFSNTVTVTSPHHRTMLNLASFSNPNLFFEAIGSVGGGTGTFELQSCGTTETGIACSVVGGSPLNFVNTGPLQQQRSGSLSVTDGDRLIFNAPSNAATSNLQSATAVVTVAPSP